MEPEKTLNTILILSMLLFLVVLITVFMIGMDAMPPRTGEFCYLEPSDFGIRVSQANPFQLLVTRDLYKRDHYVCVVYYNSLDIDDTVMVKINACENLTELPIVSAKPTIVKSYLETSFLIHVNPLIDENHSPICEFEIYSLNNSEINFTNKVKLRDTW